MDEEILSRVKISSRTSITEATQIICKLADIFEMWNRIGGDEDFFEFIFQPLFDEEDVSGEKQLDEIKDFEEMTEWQGEPLVRGFKEACVQLALMSSSCAFAIQAIKAKRNSNIAWSYACEAYHWLGVLQGYISGRAVNDRKLLAKEGGIAKNAPIAKLREWTIDKYTKGNWPSAYKASFDIAPSAIEHAPKLGIKISEQRAQQTIYEWFCKYKKSQITD